MRALVCGGRAYKDVKRIFTVLDTVADSLPKGEDLEIIEGHAGGIDTFTLKLYGADFIAHEFAIDRKLVLHCYPAQWDKQGKSAGFVRNSRMLKEGKPDLVIAFPGGPGTKMMKEIAEKAGVEVLDIEA